MKVVLEIITGALFYVQVKNDATVADLKREIEALQKIPYNRLILVPDNNDHRPLLKNNDEEEKVSLIDCGLKDGSHIYLFFVPLDEDPNHTHANNNHSVLPSDLDHQSRKLQTC